MEQTPTPAPKPRKLIKFEKLTTITGDLTDWEAGFIASIDNQLNRYGKSIDELSEKQLGVIDKIYDKYVKTPDEDLVPEKEGVFAPPEE